MKTLLAGWFSFEQNGRYGQVTSSHEISLENGWNRPGIPFMSPLPHPLVGASIGKLWIHPNTAK
jgi:hypothetical protein